MDRARPSRVRTRARVCVVVFDGRLRNIILFFCYYYCCPVVALCPAGGCIDDTIITTIITTYRWSHTVVASETWRSASRKKKKLKIRIRVYPFSPTSRKKRPSTHVMIIVHYTRI